MVRTSLLVLRRNPQAEDPWAKTPQPPSCGPWTFASLHSRFSDDAHIASSPGRRRSFLMWFFFFFFFLSLFFARLILDCGAHAACSQYSFFGFFVLPHISFSYPKGFSSRRLFFLVPPRTPPVCTKFFLGNRPPPHFPFLAWPAIAHVSPPLAELGFPTSVSFDVFPFAF